jgi:hypothetical protein
MRATVALARQYGVAIGAHPGFIERANFGRTERPVDANEVAALVVAQVENLISVAGEVPRHVKLHGALYNQVCRSLELSRGLARVIAARWPSMRVVALAGSTFVGAARAEGLAVDEEAFIDRSYEADGTLTPRGINGSVLHDVNAAAARAVTMVKGGRVEVRTGRATSAGGHALPAWRRRGSGGLGPRCRCTPEGSRNCNRGTECAVALMSACASPRSFPNRWNHMNPSLPVVVRGVTALLVFLVSSLLAAGESPLRSVGITVGDSGNPFFVQIAKGAEVKARELGGAGVKVSAVSAGYDLNQQANQIDDFIAAKVDLIVLNAADSKGIAPAVKKARAAGIQVVAVDVAAEGGWGRR